MFKDELDASDRWLEDISRSDYKRLIRKMHTNPADLKDYEIVVIGIHSSVEAEQAREWRRLGGTPEQRREEAERQERERVQTQKRDAVAAAIRPKSIVWRTPELAALADHIEQLCVTHDVTVINCGVVGRACAHQDARTIQIAPITNHTTYAVALHELGHLSPDGDSRQFEYVTTKDSLIAIHGEVGAWRWALKHARVFTAEMHKHLCDALLSYKSYTTSLDERDAIAQCIRESNDRVSDRPDTPDALHHKVLEAYETSAPAQVRTKDIAPPVNDATQIEALTRRIATLEKALEQQPASTNEDAPRVHYRAEVVIPPDVGELWCPSERRSSTGSDSDPVHDGAEEDGEPTVTLHDGTRVLAAFHGWVADLLERGHVITADDEGHLSIDPPLGDDSYVWELLENSASDTRAIVADLER